MSSLLFGEFYVPPPRDKVRYTQHARYYDVREFEEGRDDARNAVSEFVGFDCE